MDERLTRRRRVSRLVAAWVAYWVALVAVALGRAIAAVWQLKRTGAKGNFSAGFDDGLLRAQVVHDGVTAWSAATPVGTALLWLVVPPLLMWIVWLATSGRVAGPRRVESLRAGDAMPMPGARDGVRVDRDRDA